MTRLLEFAILLFWFLFVSRLLWSFWLRKLLIKEGIIADGNKAKQSTDKSTPTGESIDHDS